jgi:uncharacterized protein YcbK (DUF882 family)
VFGHRTHDCPRGARDHRGIVEPGGDPMLPIFIKLHLMLGAMWSTFTAPPPPPPPPPGVEVTLFNDAGHDDLTVTIGRDGAVDPSTAKALSHLFRCRFTDRERAIDRGTLAMIADLGARYPGKRIEFLSGYRTGRKESWTSPHRAGRALDFRIPGVRPREIRDYLWATYTHVGVGWYPNEDFLHVDHRPDDLAWTFLKGKNYYSPGWSMVVRDHLPTRPTRRPGA